VVSPPDKPFSLHLDKRRNEIWVLVLLTRGVFKKRFSVWHPGHRFFRK